ncbi:hypothetical protein RSAG8_13750, partial [Rhizoctonia solani AG-8 WAC10335]
MASHCAHVSFHAASPQSTHFLFTNKGTDT